MILDEMIYDRTQADVDRVHELKVKYLNGTITEAEKNEYEDGMKGAMNAKDLNRIGSAMKYVADYQTMFGKPVTVSVKTNWSFEEIPTSAEMDSIVQGLNNIKVADAYNAQLPTTFNNLTYTSVNAIEEMLFTLGSKYTNSASSLPHIACTCGRPIIGNRR